MALEEEQASTEQENRDAAGCLADCADLAGVDSGTLQTLAAGAVHFSLAAGHVLFEADAAPDGVYLVVSGKLGLRLPRTSLRDAASPAGPSQWQAEIVRGELVGESGWLLKEPRTGTVVALRDSEVLLLPNAVLDAVVARCASFALSMARLCARRLRRSNRRDHQLPRRARVFTIVPHSEELDVVNLATLLVTELGRSGRAELVWDARARTHTSAWFNLIEELNEYVVYVADPGATGWTRQCCRQADVILLAATARAEARPWPAGIADVASARGARIELALLHEGSFEPGAAARWLTGLPVNLHHHLVTPADLGRVARLLTRRAVGLVLSGGGARGFAHLGVIRALREAQVPLDFVGGASIGGIFAAGVAMGWSDAEMRGRYRRGFVDSNPVNDYTFPRVALTRGRKVTRLLEREYGTVDIEDLLLPFFCVSANLTTGLAFEHRTGRLSDALRASVAIPGIMPPVYCDDGVLVDGAAINNLPVDLMQNHAPGIVIGCDVGADHALTGARRANIFQILVQAGMVNGAASAAAQRRLADVMLKPPLTNVDLLDWQAFDRAIDAGYDYARQALVGLPGIPRLPAAAVDVPVPSSLNAELARRLGARHY